MPLGSEALAPGLVGVLIAPKLGCVIVIVGPLESMVKVLSEKSLLTLPAVSVALTRTRPKVVSTKGTVQKYGLKLFVLTIVCQVDPLLIEYSNRIFCIPRLSLADQAIL